MSHDPDLTPDGPSFLVSHLFLGLFLISAPFSVALSQIGASLACLAWMFQSVRARTMPRFPVLLPLAAFVVASLIAALAAVDPEKSLRELRGLWIPLGIFFTTVNVLAEPRRARIGIRVLVASTAVAASLAIGQSFVHGVDVRASGTLSHYMTFAGVLLIVGLLAAAQLLFDRSTLRGAWTGMALTLIVAALLLTQTRGAWLAFLVGCTILAWLWRRWTVLLVPVLALAVFVVSPSVTRERMKSLVDLEHVTMVERLHMWDAGLAAAREHPITGVGPGNMRSLYAGYKDPNFELERPFKHLHSSPLQILAERGLVGLVAWASIWVAFFHAAIRRLRTTSVGDAGTRRAIVAGSIAAVGATLVAGLFECNYRDTEVCQLLYFSMALLFVDDSS